MSSRRDRIEAAHPPHGGADWGAATAAESMAAAEPTKLVHRLDRLAWWLDSSVRLPLTRMRIGIDGIISLVPVLGDVASAALSLYLIVQARRFRLPIVVIGRMLWNMIVDMALGSIPIIGDVFDFGFKANRRNVELLRRSLAPRAG